MNGVASSMPGATSPAIPPSSNGGVNKVAGVNSIRITVAAERLANCCASNKPADVTCFYNLCISLARGIDYAVAISETPDYVSKLPEICMQVCRKKTDCSLQAAIMVLMVAMKHACKAHWFSAEDTRKVLALADEVGRIFNTPEGFSSELTKVIPTVSQIMSRYYPQIKLGHILIYADIKPGFQACAVSFHVSKSMRTVSSGNIQLLVAMKDNIDTSACTINPPKVNLLLNGKGVPWRMVGYMETGPQLPTDVTQMLRYGTNLLQAIGHFEAHCVVLVAFMSFIPSSFLPVPADYEQPAPGTVESDAEVVEGSSRISLNCPISFSRISKPAKGKLCKHLQCFDLSNYVEMNSRRPSWRCPTCNQPVCYHDLRIDRKMSKILHEVAKDVANVIFHSDGSWEAIPGSAEQKDEPPVKPSEVLQGGSDQQVASGLPNETHDVYDLTEGDDEPVIMDVDTPEDTKPVLKTNILSTSTYTNHVGPSIVGDTPEINQQTSATQVQGLACSGPSELYSGSAAFSSRTNGQPGGGISALMRGQITPSPVLTDSVSPAIRREQHNFLGTNQQSSPLTLVPSTNGLVLQHAQRPQMMGSEYAGHAIPRNVARVPTANQAHPRPMPRPNPMMANSSLTNNLSGNASSLPSRAALFPPVSANTSTPNRGSVQQPQLTQQMRGHNAPGQVPNNGFRATPGSQAANQPRPTENPPHMVRTPPHLRARTQAPPGGSLSNLNRTSTTNRLYDPMTAASQAASIAAASQAALRARQLNTAPIQIPTSRPSTASVPRPANGTSYVSQDRGPTSGPAQMAQTVSRTQDLIGAQSEQNWQPTGRMRGSLTGRAYSDAISEFMIRPTQQTTPAPTPAPAAVAAPPEQPNPPQNNS